LTNLPEYSVNFKNSLIRFGKFGVQAAKAGLLTKKQIEAVRVSLRRPIKSIPGSRVWVLVKPDRIMTKRASETRMGKGKGSPFLQVNLITKGQILFEIQGPTYQFMQKVFDRARKKLPVPTSYYNIKWLDLFIKGLFFQIF
jgi:large subunit ribosomal protein L16